jgi:hypothetical protein
VTTVINIKNEKREFYDTSCDVYIGRPGPFGNPFRIGPDGDREQVIAKYRTWFYNKLKDEAFRGSVEALKGKRLLCWCKPDACHGDVIVEYLEGIKNEKHRNTPSVDFTAFQ